MGVYIWKNIDTFTISWEEKSDMSSGWTYSDGAAGLTAGDTLFDEFFGYSAVRLDSSGNETASITQAASGGAGKLDITQLGTLTSGDNVMIKFPARGIKMTKSGSIVTLSITEKLNEPGYQYLAHQRGTLSSPGNIKNAMYLGAYLGSNDNSVIKSWSGKSPLTSQTNSAYSTKCQANGTGYDMMYFYQLQLINAYYVMKYGNPNCKTTIGTAATSGTTTGGTNSILSASSGGSNTQLKLFGLEDWWGYYSSWIGGAYLGASRHLYVMLNGWAGSISGGEDTGVICKSTSNTNISSISGTNNGMFIPTSGVSNSSFNTYYCSYGEGTASRLIATDGDGTAGGKCIFNFRGGYSVTIYNNARCGRLMYL